MGPAGDRAKFDRQRGSVTCPFVTRLLAATSLLLALVVLAPGVAVASIGMAQSDGQGNLVRLAQELRPYRVSGYSTHARVRMAERDISPRDVVELIESDVPGVYQQHNDTWLVEGEGYVLSNLAVSINRNGYIVTVY
jgi:hypothetical protein